MSEIILSAKNITKSYPQGSGELHILRDVSLDIYAGEDICIVGASGAGKSTLLHILGTLDRPSSGDVFFKQQSLFTMNEDEVAQFRNQTMGFVFQFHHLLAEFTALENVMIPSRIAGESKAQAAIKAFELLDTMGIRERANHYPNQLSGGELQRVAIARALMQNPKILLADEPTGNLDSHNSQNVQQLFFDLKKKYGLTLIVVTHDAQFASKFSKVLRMSDGQWAKSF